MTARGRYGTLWGDRLGFPLAGGRNPLWFHAASVGEVQSALTIIDSIVHNLPQARFVLSAGTPAGLERARVLSRERPVQILAPPLDFFGSPGRALDRIGPRALVLVETELWPELIRQAQKRAVPVMILAGRMSQKSYRRYRRVRSFFKPLLAEMELTAVISEKDRDRFVDLGCRAERTAVAGNPKFDFLARQALQAPPSHNRPLGRKLIIGGSTAEREEELVVKAWLDQPPVRPWLLLAPRHLERVPQVLEQLRRQNLSVRLWSERPAPDWSREPDIILIDVLGILAQLYALADLAVIGGSFYRGQGHNPLEPAVFGVPQVFGPFMSSFDPERIALEEAGAARTVNPSDLSGFLASWLARGEEVLNGAAGRDLLARRPPAGPILAELAGHVICPDIKSRPAAG
jgi:3-deoxy-D-manno-octulosonic-acid transferase